MQRSKMGRAGRKRVQQGLKVQQHMCRRLLQAAQTETMK